MSMMYNQRGHVVLTDCNLYMVPDMGLGMALGKLPRYARCLVFLDSASHSSAHHHGYRCDTVGLDEDLPRIEVAGYPPCPGWSCGFNIMGVNYICTIPVDVRSILQPSVSVYIKCHDV